MEDTNDLPEDVIEEETPDEQLTDETDWKAEALKARRMTARLRNQLTKATEKKVAPPEPAKPVTEPAPKTGELDENALDFLDLKGVTHSDDIRVIEQIVQRTGMTVRQALKDDYVVAKLEANKNAREVKDATPSSTRRSGGGVGETLEAAVAKYKAANYHPSSLPSDFAARSAVINAVAAETNENKPAWK